MLSPTRVARRAVASAATPVRPSVSRQGQHAGGGGGVGGGDGIMGSRIVAGRIASTGLVAARHITSNSLVAAAGARITAGRAPPTSRRSLTGSSAQREPETRIPPDAPQLRYTTPGSPDEPVTVAWTAEAIFACVDGQPGVRTLHATTLRDSCACARCRDAISGNKTYRSTELPDDLAVAAVEPGEAGLTVTFAYDVARLSDGGPDRLHRTLVPWAAVEEALGRAGAREPDAGRVLFPSRRGVLTHTGVRYWDAAVLAAEVRVVDFADYMAGGRAFWDAVIDLCRLGIVYLSGVPRDEGAVAAVATRIANVRETLYGRTFDVRAKPDADNVASTGAALGLHQDLLYLYPPPMIQVLHCLDDACAGGESLFSDGARAAHLLWPYVRASHRLAPLRTDAVAYRCAKPGFRYHARRPVLAAAAGAGPEAVPNLFWSPPFQAPHEHAARDLRPWLAAARVLERVLADDAAVHRRKLRPGDCVLFDNLRVLHGRTAFDPADRPAAGPARWLRGAYIAADDFLSRAAHVPLDQARAARGPAPWTPAVARDQLRRSPWHQQVRDLACEFDPHLARRFVR